MRVTRRQFLGCAAAVSWPRWRIDHLTPAPPSASGISILDLGNSCSLHESLSGYKRALGARVLDLELVSATRPATLIVPAAVEIPPTAVRAITACLAAGGLVMLESGAGFASERARSRHRAVLREALGVHVESPVDLWPHRSIPYVDFTWPVAAKVRDFSRVVPLTSGAREIIARVNGLPVALRRRSARGTLIVLGSPLGPALWAGDAAALQWLLAVVKATPGWG